MRRSRVQSSLAAPFFSMTSLSFCGVPRGSQEPEHPAPNPCTGLRHAESSTVTDEQVNAAVDAYLADSGTKAGPNADGYGPHLAAAVVGHGWASSVVASPKSSPSLTRGAIILARSRKARPTLTPRSGNTPPSPALTSRYQSATRASAKPRPRATAGRHGARRFRHFHSASNAFVPLHVEEGSAPKPVSSGANDD